MTASRPRRFPAGGEYTEALQSPKLAFPTDADLRDGIVESNVLGLPKPRSGNFASVFKVTAPSGDDFAVKCFLSPPSDQAERYAAIHDTLAGIDEGWATGFVYYEEGINVNGNLYPLLKMEWVDGDSLGAFVSANYENRTLMATLAVRLAETVASLRERDIAHGDLQHGNVLVASGGEIRLIDYDGVYVPALSSQQPPNEMGHQNFQSPQRTIPDYGPNLDNFSAWSIYLSLISLAVSPELWDVVNRNEPDCLLFRKVDYTNPDESPAFEAIRSLEDPTLNEMLDNFASYCRVPLSEIPPLGATPPMPAGAAEGVPAAKPKVAKKQPKAWVDEDPTAVPGEKPGTLLWEAEFRGELHSAPVIHGGVAYVGDDRGGVHAVSTVDGHIVWSFQTGGPITCAPVVIGQALYVASRDRHIYALDLNTGDAYWSFQVWAEVAELAYAEIGALFVTCWDRVYALNPSTSEEFWNKNIGGGNQAAVIINDLLVVGAEKFLHALDLNTGKPRWKFKHGGSASRPVVQGGQIFVSGRGRHYAVDPAKGNSVWETKASGNPTMLAATEDTVYADNGDGHLVSLDPATGSARWSYPAGIGVAPPVAANGLLHIGAYTQHIHAIETDNPEEEAWKSEQNVGAVAGLVIQGDLLIAASRNHFLYGYRTRG